MAYTNNNGQTRVGVRIVPLSVVIPTTSALLDSYSGALVAYSLRKLSATYTGSAIRVRRSSDNTEQNIGFDSNGNLDTYALSSFVGSGSGYVTTWYDQSGNGNNATKTIASSQPRIVNAGIIETVGGKPAIRWLVIGGAENLLSMNTSLSNVRSVFLNITYLSGIARVPLLGHTTAYDYHSDADVHLSSQYAADYVKNGNNYINGVSKTLATFAKSTSNSLITMIHTSASGNVNQISSDRNIGRWDWSFFTGYFSEIILYSSDQTTNRTQIESNINSYYSIYPNPTSVWNLLNAVYNADTTASSSLKTSLYAVYNGESNANDSFGTNNGTAVGGLTYTTGKIGNAFQFNGSNAYVSLPNNSLNFTGDFSISFWAYYNSTAAAYEVFISNYNNPSGANYGFQLYTDPSNMLMFDLYGGSLQSNLYTPFTPVANSWYMFTITRKRSTETKVYINGTSQSSAFYAPGSQGATFNQTYDSNQIVNFGSNLNGGALSNIKMDAVNFWTKVLTQAEITELYNSGNGAQYITDNFYKPTTNDALNTYNGTAQGGLTWGVGKVGTAFQFNGTNAYVQLPNNSLNLTGPYSISMWVYFATDPSSLNGFYFMNAYNATAETGFEYRVRFGKPEIGFFTSGGLYTYWYAPNVNITSAGWYNLTLVKPLNQQPQLYLNGSSTLTSIRISNSTVTEVTYTSPVKCSIGNNITLLANYMPNGSKIDALNVWNKELSASEITELYNSGNGKQYPN